MTPVIIIRLVDSGSAAYGASTTSTGTVHLWGAMATDIGDLTNIVAYQPSTTQIHREYAPTLQTAAINAPRFEYSASDSASMGLLIEGSSTNLVSYSESFSNQTISSSTLTEGAAVGPDGTLNANLLVPTATGTLARNVNLEDGNSFSHTSGNNYAYSIFAKAAGYSYLQWVGLAYFGYTYCNFDLSNGTVGNKSGSVTGSVESVGNGWYRLTVVAPATTTNSSSSKGVWAVVTSSTSGRVEQFTGDGYSGVLLTMAQCELGSFASSYIKSDSGSVSGTTRASDSASLVSSNLFDNGEGALFVENKQPNATQNNSVVSITDGGSSNYVRIRGNFSNFRGEVYNNAAIQADLFGGTNDTNFHKQCITFGNNNVSFYVDGNEKGSTDTTGVIPELNTIRIGWAPIISNGNQHIRRVAVYGSQISETEAAAITS